MEAMEGIWRQYGATTDYAYASWSLASQRCRMEEDVEANLRAAHEAAQQALSDDFPGQRHAELVKADWEMAAQRLQLLREQEAQALALAWKARSEELAWSQEYGHPLRTALKPLPNQE